MIRLLLIETKKGAHARGGRYSADRSSTLNALGDETSGNRVALGDHRRTARGEKLTGSGQTGPATFGSGVALSANGHTALIDGPYADKGVGAA